MRTRTSLIGLAEEFANSDAVMSLATDVWRDPTLTLRLATEAEELYAEYG